MSESIKPALTVEEWARLKTWLPLTATIENATTMDLCVMADRSRPALAALALYGQPFGFTRDDAEALERAMVSLVATNDDRRARVIRSIADRIEALLPPEG